MKVVYGNVIKLPEACLITFPKLVSYKFTLNDNSRKILYV